MGGERDRERERQREWEERERERIQPKTSSKENEKKDWSASLYKPNNKAGIPWYCRIAHDASDF